MGQQEGRQENILQSLPVGKLLYTMAWPLMLSMLISACYNIVDGIFVAHLSADAFVALSLAYPVQTFTIAVAVGTGVGINAVLSRYLGRGQQARADAVACHSYFLYFLYGIAFAVFALLGARAFLSAFTESTAVLDLGTTYLHIVTGLSMGQMMQFSGERIMQATGNPFRNLYIQATGGIINLILDPLLIFGPGIFPHLGMAGAALATVIGQWVGALIGIYLTARRVKEVHVSMRHFRPQGEICGEIYRIALPAIVMQSFATLLNLGLNKILIGYSHTQILILGAYFKIQNFVFMPIFGLGNGMIPIVSFNFGARQAVRVEKTVRLGILAALVIILIGTTLLLTIPGPLLRLFDATPQMLTLGIPALRTASLSFAAAAVSIILCSTLQALDSSMDSLVLSLLRQVVLLLPLAWIFAQINVAAVWYAFPLTEVVCCAAALWLYVRVRRKRLLPLKGERT